MTRYLCCLTALYLVACDRPSTPGETQQNDKPTMNTPAATDTPVARELPEAERPQTVGSAEAKMGAAPGQTVKGALSFEQNAQGVRVTGQLNANPGPHGFHVHEKGNCSDIPGKSMGDHFAPDGHAHALPAEGSDRHLGDLGNIVMDANSTAHVDFVIVGANLKQGDAHSLLGKSVVLHAGEDSGKAHQPAGDSGVPIACGVIEAS